MDTIRATLPAETRRDYRPIYGLTYREIAILAGIGGAGLRLWETPMPTAVHVALLLPIVVAGWAVSPFGRWPLGEAGEPILIWLGRVVHFYGARQRRLYR